MSKRSPAVQAFWAMHVEALNWSESTAAHRISANSLRRWRDLLENGEVEIDWRARLHPSALPTKSTGANSSANDCAAESALTAASDDDSQMPEKRTRRTFSAEEKLAIVLES